MIMLGEVMFLLILCLLIKLSKFLSFRGVFLSSVGLVLLHYSLN